MIDITGMGCICASGVTSGEMVASIFDGCRNYSFAEGVRASHETIYPVFPVVSDDLKDCSEITRCGSLALHAAREALGGAGFFEDLDRMGVCIGTTAGNAINRHPFYRDYLSGNQPSISAICEYVEASPAEFVANELGLGGPVQTITNACSSGAVAIGEAASWIRAGLCDAAIAGGADKLCPVICNGFVSLLIADAAPCRPFDCSRKGLNLGEGAGVFVLESRESSKRRGVSPRAQILGYGNASDAYHLSTPDPSGAGLKCSIAAAMEQGGLAAHEIAFVNAHGTGTRENDRMELSVQAELFPNTPFFSLKGYTGHTLGAAGAIEAVATVAFLERRQIPGSAGFESSEEGMLDPTSGIQSIDGGVALTNSVAFGGNCASLVIGGVA